MTAPGEDEAVCPTCRDPHWPPSERDEDRRPCDDEFHEDDPVSREYHRSTVQRLQRRRMVCESVSGGYVCGRPEGHRGVHRSDEDSVSWGTHAQLVEALAPAPGRSVLQSQDTDPEEAP